MKSEGNESGTVGQLSGSSRTVAVYKDRTDKRIVLCVSCADRIRLGRILRFIEWTDLKCSVCHRPLGQ